MIRSDNKSSFIFRKMIEMNEDFFDVPYEEWSEIIAVRNSYGGGYINE